jgi:endonuclease YncB( thermonuclease family)
MATIVSGVSNKIVHEGLLEVHGTIPFQQFYYQGGESDADTVKLLVESMRFSHNGNSAWRDVSHTFDDAMLRGKKVIKNSKITIRLQGIDAPELHYETEPRTEQDREPDVKQNWNYSWFRQHRGARAVYELEKFLRNYTVSDSISAYVYTRVDHPNDVFDMYGRFIGDIVLTKDSINVNLWLVEEGWAFPTYYNSMTKQEIQEIDTKTKTAADKSKGIWKGYSSKMVHFDFNLTTAKGVHANRIDPGTDDAGSLNLPKLFRRQVDYEVRKKAGEMNGSFVNYLSTRKDKCFLTSDFLRGVDPQITYLDKQVKEDGTIKFRPGDLVFVEDNSQVLKDSNGNKIEDWI